MFSWIILAGLLLGFMIGTFYLFCYWTINSIKPDPLMRNGYKRLKRMAKIDRKTYEYAYQNNTNFYSDEDSKGHQTYDLYDNYNKAPHNRKKNIDWKEEDKEEYIRKNVREKKRTVCLN